MDLYNYKTFLDVFFDAFVRKGFDKSSFSIDHLGYQSSSSENYEEVKQHLLSSGVLLSEAIVGDRRVGILQLTKPLEYENQKISVIEVVEPKKEQIIDEGWEHVELIYKFGIDKLLTDYSDIEWDKSVFDREDFPMLIVHLDNGMRAKFPTLGVLEELKRQERS